MLLETSAGATKKTVRTCHNSDYRLPKQDCNVFVTELSPGVASKPLALNAGRQAYLLCVEGEARLLKQDLARHDAAEIKGPGELELAAGPSGCLVLMFEMTQTRDSRRGL